MSICRSLPVLVCLPFICGCVEVEEEIVISNDGSGDVELTVTFPSLGVRWLPEKPTAVWIKPWLPDDVKLTSFSEKKTRTTVTDPQGKNHKVDALTYTSRLTFKNANDLGKIRVKPDDRNQIAASGGATPGKEAAMKLAPVKKPPDIGPFQKISFVRKDNTLHFRRVIQSARKAQDVEASMMKTPGSDAMPQAFSLGSSHLSISIKCPGKVIEHNAHSVNGNTLNWKFKLQDLQDKQDRDWIIEFKCRVEDQ